MESLEAVVEVAGGAVRGVRRAGVWGFAGIPYARSPAGPRRWRPPEPPEPWPGVRPADAFGPIAPQVPPVPGLSIPGDPETRDEDCLNLNVWSPDLEGRRPVMVWIHGGGFTTGTGAGLLYRGGPLARRDTVVVTANYRLGALGFLGHPVVHHEGQVGNWGLLDQVAVLAWVRDHIGAFGGDPAAVTLFGESAGSMSVAALLAAPAARGLFQRAVLQSGPAYTHDPGRAERAGEELFARLGLVRPTRADLEAVPAAALVEATAAMQDRPPDPGELPLPFLPVVDGTVLPEPPLTAIRAGAAAGVPLVVGTTRDELSLFALGTPGLADMDESGLARWMARAAPGLEAESAVAHYRQVRAGRGEPTDVRSLWVAMGTDLVFRWPTLQLAAAHRHHQPDTYAYLFTHESPAFGGVLGSCHALDIPFVFGSVHRPPVALLTGTGPHVDALAETMGSAWAGFARTATPGPPGTWPRFEPDRRPTMVFGPEIGAVDDPRADELEVWAARDRLVVGP